MLVFFSKKYIILDQCKGVLCVDLGESIQTHIFLQKLASIQPRTRPVKFARSSGCSQWCAREELGDGRGLRLVPSASPQELRPPPGLRFFQTAQKNYHTGPRLWHALAKKTFSDDVNQSSNSSISSRFYVFLCSSFCSQSSHSRA